MASRSIKGILARNSWDFYEYATGWAYIEGTTAGQGSLAYLMNPGTQQANLDIYRAEISLAKPESIEWAVYSLGFNAGPDISTEKVINACETNQAMPLGTVGLVAAPWTGQYLTLRSRFDSIQYDLITLGLDGPFVTLAPGWTLVMQQTSIGTTQIGVTFFFQTILDQIPQAK